jgi:hypothetical protein
MSRAFWFAAGAATSAYAFVKARRAAEALTPEGVRDRLSGLTLAAQLLADEIREEATAKEADLRTRLGLVPHARPAPATSVGYRTALDGPDGVDGPDGPDGREAPDGGDSARSLESPQGPDRADQPPLQLTRKGNT